jgi:hypothetical protein
MSRLEKYARQLGTNDPTVKKLLEVAEYKADMRGSIANYFLRLLEERAGSVIDLPPFTIAPPSRDYNNPLPIGTALRGNGPGYDYMVDMDSFTQSGGIFGIPGSGKSTLAQVMAMSVVKAGGRMIIFDVMHEHHKLIQAFPPGDVCVLELGKTERENPLEPPGKLPPKDWIGIKKNVLREQFLRDGSTNLFEDIMNRAYRSYG